MKKKSKKRAPIQIALIQMSCSADPAENLKKALERVRRAASRGAKVVCLQELFRTEYFCKTEDVRNFDLAETIPGPSTDALSKAARVAGVVVVASLFEKRARGIYHNTAVVIDADGKLLGSYRKMHIPDDPGFHEKFYFVPGDLGFRAFKTRHGTIAVLVCWDQWFPEAARLAALAGADVLFYPTAIGWKAGEGALAKRYEDAWRTIQRGHAIANGVYVAAVNRVGREGDFKYWGGSFVADPFGEIVAKAGVGEEILLAECDPAGVETTRREWPFLRDRRIDAYGDLTSRTVDARV